MILVTKDALSMQFRYEELRTYTGALLEWDGCYWNGGMEKYYNSLCVVRIVVMESISWSLPHRVKFRRHYGEKLLKTVLTLP